MNALVTGFGPFPGMASNATEHVVRGLSAADGVTSLVLPVEWARAASLAIDEARRTGATLLLMNGVAGARQPLWLERGASSIAAERADAAGVMPDRWPSVERLALSIDVDVAVDCATRALAPLAHVLDAGERLDAILHGAVAREIRDDNAYVCNDASFRVQRAFAGTGVRVGFIHWPSDLRGAHVDAARQVLLAVVRGLSR